MSRPGRYSLLAGLLTLFAVLDAKAQTTASDTLPAGVTTDMVARGKTIYTGAGVCFACHGMAGEGVAGPSLADTVWLHSRGEYEKILTVILSGISAKESKSGVIMPPRGGSAINDADVRAVAAYVWSLSRKPAAP
jgi:mono/diheme cytochrome c family protein